MERVTIGIFLALGAVIVIAWQAPPKVYENVKTYYKTLIQAPAAQVTAFTSRQVKPKPFKPPVVAEPPKPSKSSSGPSITVLGGIPWEREPHASRARATAAPAEDDAADTAVQSRAGNAVENVSTENPATTNEEQVTQAQ